MKIKNLNLESLIGAYSKIVNTEFDDYDLAIKVAKDAFAIEDLMKAYIKLRESLIKKNTVDDGSKFKIELTEKFKIELEKLNSVEQEIELIKLPKYLIKTIKLKPLEAKLLNDLELVFE
jgi:hypothetical protein